MTGRTVLATLMVAAAALGACRGDVSDRRPRQFFPDLDDQPKVKAQSESRFFADYTDEDGAALGRGARLPVPGVVPFGATAHAGAIAGHDFGRRDEFLRDDVKVATGREYITSFEREFMRDEETGGFAMRPVDTIPIAVDMDLLREGQKQYNIFCLPCHGATGHGDGTVGSRWSYTLPDFHAEQYQPGGELGQDGHIFHTIRNGIANVGGSWKLRMPAYGSRLTIRETWAVVAYLRALQRAERGSAEDLNDVERMELDRRRVTSAPGLDSGVGLASGDGSAKEDAS